LLEADVSGLGRSPPSLPVNNTYRMTAMTTTPKTQAMTIPAMAPPPRPEGGVFTLLLEFDGDWLGTGAGAVGAAGAGAGLEALP
jgi:hypothetical protein